MDHLIKLFVSFFGFFIKLKASKAEGGPGGTTVTRIERWGLVYAALTSAWDPAFNFDEIKDAIKGILADATVRLQFKTDLKVELDKFYAELGMDDQELDSLIDDGLDVVDTNYAYTRRWIDWAEKPKTV